MLVNNKVLNGRNNRQLCQVDLITRGSREEQRDESMKKEPESEKRVLDGEGGRLSVRRCQSLIRDSTH